MAKIIDFYPNYRDKFIDDFQGQLYYSSYNDSIKSKNFRVMTIGDSFSEQFSYGYKNYLAKDVEVFHINRFLSFNQLETLLALTKSDFFTNYKFEYVILQCVERDFVKLSKKIDFNKRINIGYFDSIVDKREISHPDYSYKFPSKRIFSVFVNSLKYKFNTNQIFEQKVVHAHLKTNTLFSNNTRDFLFYYDDLLNLKFNNDKKNISQLNVVLNTINKRLNQKGIKLIVLPSPDKYDLYYEYLEGVYEYEKPMFFDLLAQEKKEYYYIDAKEILKKNLHKTSDIYFYDDTHWSPIASKIIADEIKKVLEK